MGCNSSRVEVVGPEQDKGSPVLPSPPPAAPPEPRLPLKCFKDFAKQMEFRRADAKEKDLHKLEEMLLHSESCFKGSFEYQGTKGKLLDLTIRKTENFEEGLICIASMLKINCPIGKLTIQSTSITALAISEISRSISFNETLEELSFVLMDVSTINFNQLIVALNDMPQLKAFRLLGVKLGKNIVKSLVDTLLLNTTLKQLTMKDCMFDENVDGLVDILKANTSITSMQVENLETLSKDRERKNEMVDILDRNQCVESAIEFFLDSLIPILPDTKRRTFASKLASNNKVTSFAKKTSSKKATADGKSQSFVPFDLKKVDNRVTCIPSTSTINKRPFIFGFCDSIGRRAAMEDQVLIRLNLNGNAHEHLFAVFDGHGGTQCSKLVAYNFVSCFEKVLNETSTNQSLADQDLDQEPSDENGADSIECALLETFSRINQMCKDNEVKNGTCALVTYICNEYMHTACSGDSAGVLSRNGKAVDIAHVLRPTDEEEQSRIQELGGFVSRHGRVGGILAVSRALGDVSFQPFVSPVPTVRRIKLEQQDEFFSLACDGLWDVCDSQQCVDLVRSVHEPRLAASKLVDHAIQNGSNDNVSAIVVMLG